MSRGGEAELARFAPRPGKQVVMVVGLAVFAGFAAWLLWVTPPEAWEAEGTGAVRMVLRAVAILCPLYAADLAARLLRATPTLLATQAGLVFRSALGVKAAVRWEEIAMIAPVEMSRKPWLAIYLHEPRETLARFGLLGRLMLTKSHGEGVPNLAFRTIQLGIRPVEAARALESIRAQQVDRSNAGHEAGAR